MEIPAKIVGAERGDNGDPLARTLPIGEKDPAIQAKA
jgi:hypothetical protein